VGGVAENPVIFSVVHNGIPVATSKDQFGVTK
jgi:hypothetical protein